jgi:formylmethanofuran dehydrogenase subunit E
MSLTSNMITQTKFLTLAPTHPLFDALAQSAAQHDHLCPRQVLGARMGLLGARLLGVEQPNSAKRLLTFVETDGCAADGLSAATGCTVGHRTLRVIDFGKVAATFVDTHTGEAIRIAPSRAARELASQYAPRARSRWQAQLEAYQVIPDEELLRVQHVELSLSLEKLLSKPGYRVTCQVCGEEILNEREVLRDGAIVCATCAGAGYYKIVQA